MSFLRLAGEFTEAVYQAGREIPEAVSQAVRWQNGEDMKKEQGLYYKFNILIVGSIFICGIHECPKQGADNMAFAICQDLFI